MKSSAFLICCAALSVSLVMIGSAARADALLAVNATADPSQGNILQYDLGTGAPIGSGLLVAAGVGGLNAPTGLAVGPGGDLFVSNGFDSSVLEFSPEGNPARCLRHEWRRGALRSDEPGIRSRR